MGNVFKAQITLSDACVNRCWDCIGGRWVYVSELEPNLRLLQESIDELGGLRNDVMTRISLEERRGMKRLDQVTRWLSRVDTKIKNVNELLGKRQNELTKLCIGDCCSTNYVSSYKYGKKVVKRLKEVDDLITKGKDFKELATLALPEPKIGIPCGPTVGLAQTLDCVCSYLSEEHVSIVGLYGKGGVGKSEVLKQVNNRSCSGTSCFDLVMWVAVSKPVTIESIQNEIGKKIGFSGEEWMSKSLSEKAGDIFNVLNRKKFVLLLDDVWEKLDLTNIGVRLTTPCVSKVVFTTQLEAICFQMRAHKHVKVEPLGPEDSWILFTDIMGEDTFMANPEIFNLARVLVEECGGVAQELVKLAHSMACKRTVQDWHDSRTVVGSNSQDEIVESRPTIEDREEDDEDEEEKATIYGSPITDKTLMGSAGYVSGRRLTAARNSARNRAVRALEREKEAGQDSEVREDVKRLKMKYGGAATICLFYNATRSTVKFSGHMDWNGYLGIGLYPIKVDNGQWGVFVHMHDYSISGRAGSRGAVVYSGEKGHDWLFAWDNPLTGIRGRTKVFTEVRGKGHFFIHWPYLYNLLADSGQQFDDKWGGAVSDITVSDEIDGPFFRATMSLDFS